MPAFRISQRRFLSKLIGANSHGKTFVVSVDPSGELGLCHPEPLANNARPERVLPTLREWLLPLGKLQRDRFQNSELDAPRGAIRENVCVTNREWLHYERSVPPRTDLSLRGLVASPYEEPFASAKRPTTCERPLRGVKGHIPT